MRKKPYRKHFTVLEEWRIQHFVEALTSAERHIQLPQEFDYFGRLIGSWKIDYVNSSNASVIKGEWHFSRILEGMGIQDVIVLPGFEYGTTLRVYNPESHVWDIAYCYTGKIMRFEATKQDGKIVLTNIENEKRKWIFAEVGDNNFHWQDIRVKDDGKWRVDFDIYAERI